MDFGEIYSEILRRAKKADMTIVSAPPVSFSSSLIHPVCMFVPALTSSHGGFCNYFCLRITIFNFWERI